MPQSDSTIPGLGSVQDFQLDGSSPPSRKLLDWLHENASTIRPEDLHHRLGFGPEDSASGDHTHDGVNSLPLFPSTVVLEYPTDEASLIATVSLIVDLLRGVGAGSPE